MENYIVSARKYRPDTFDTVVSQKSLTTTLKNAIQSGKLAHAYLFCGPRGVGKTTCARIFAKTINCQHPTATGEPCNECESCLSFNQQRSYSIYELDAASNNSVDDIRSLNEQVRIPPQVGKYKVYIIDEVHMLTQSAFNAFLKTLEEPPAHAIFILATTEKHKIIPTILSRCQIYDFSRIESADIVAHLKSIAEKEGVKAEHEALRIIAQKSDGCMRDALSLFDQMVSFTQGELTYTKVIDSLNVLDHEYYFRLTDLILDGKISQALLLFNEVLSRGFEGNIFIEGAASHFRDLLVNGDPATAPLFEGSDELRARYAEQAKRCRTKMIFNAIKLCNNCSMNYRASRNKRLLVELTIIELSQLAEDSSDDGGGRGPKALKPIFSKLPQKESTTAQQTVKESTNTPERPTSAVSTPNNSAESDNIRHVAAPTPVTRPAMEGRPPEMQVKRGGMFGGIRSRANSIAENQTTQVETRSVGTTAQHASTAPVEVPKTDKPKVITPELMAQAWRSFAMQLPESERGLADRMKIMTPEVTGENCFSVSLDNHHAADLFTKESARICKGMSAYLDGITPKMSINVNTVIVERHVSDRTKQYEILKEKNPIIEKLRIGLGLDLAR
ncbi:MAG: DNA polymerase III subunit gamma/tau [Bacteroidaceae bacterium]|nr:DNA polymerase III subunit gamma/tau [Bacteroidaceae bacterium]